MTFTPTQKLILCLLGFGSISKSRLLRAIKLFSKDDDMVLTALDYLINFKQIRLEESDRLISLAQFSKAESSQGLILSYLTENSLSTKRQICEFFTTLKAEINCPKNPTNGHLERLLDMGLVVRGRKENKFFYEVGNVRFNTRNNSQNPRTRSYFSTRIC